MMAVKEVSRAQFDAFKPYRIAMATIEERAWFVDTAKNLLGIVMLDKTDNDWGYVVQARDQNGNFRAIDHDVSIKSEDAARDTLMNKMQK
jgi:hypothetical protein